MRIFGKGGGPRDGVTAGDVAPPTKVDLGIVGNRIATVTETRPDGTKTTGVCSYSADALTEVRFTNPTRVFAYGPTGWTVT